MRWWRREHGASAVRVWRAAGIFVAISALVACTPQRTAIDPGQCREVLERGGTSAAYTQCLIEQARGKSVSGVPVLSERARAQLDSRREDPCFSGQTMSQNEYLACELARPSHPAPAREPARASEVAPLPLVVEPSQ